MGQQWLKAPNGAVFSAAPVFRDGVWEVTHGPDTWDLTDCHSVGAEPVTGLTLDAIAGCRLYAPQKLRGGLWTTIYPNWVDGAALPGAVVFLPAVGRVVAFTRERPRPVFLLPPYEGTVNTDVPVVWLDPDDGQYSAHLGAIASAPWLVLDCETYGNHDHKEGLHPWRSKIRLLQLFDGRTVYVADFGGKSFNDLPLFADASDPQVEQRERLKSFITVLRDFCQKRPVIGQNLHFDALRVKIHFDIDIEHPICTLLGSQIFFGDYGKGDETQEKGYEPILKGGYGLKNLCLRYLGIDISKEEQQSDWGLPALTENQKRYAALDTVYTYHVWQYLLALYQNPDTPLYQPVLLDAWLIENQILPVTVDMEVAGVPFDREECDRQLELLRGHYREALVEWDALSPGIGYNQRDELLKVLQAQGITGNDGQPLRDLDKATLAEHGNNPLIRLRLRLKALDVKINNLEGFRRSAQRDGRIHTVFRTLTGFGRFSCGGKGFKDLPNMQAVSAKENPAISHLKLPNPRATVRPGPGFSMAVIDLAGAHGRIAADQADDATAIAGNNDETIDNHSKVAAYVAKALGRADLTWQDIQKLCKEKTEVGRFCKLCRDTAKNTYYGWLNGAGAARIQLQIAANTGLLVPLEACQAAIEGCKVLYPNVLVHRKRLHKRLLDTSIVVDGRPVAVNSTTDGFRILLPLDVRFNKKTEALELQTPYTQSLAATWTRIEATAVKRALPQIRAQGKANPHWGLKILLCVHDEVDAEFCTEYEEEVALLLNNIVGDEFQRQLKKVKDGRPHDARKLLVSSWADK